jgi:hypothetical protein
MMRGSRKPFTRPNVDEPSVVLSKLSRFVLALVKTVPGGTIPAAMAAPGGASLIQGPN